MLKVFATWRSGTALERDQAADLFESHGSRAVDVAEMLARSHRSGRLNECSLPAGHWDRVRRRLVRMSKKDSGPLGVSDEGLLRY